jgi:hypothetical protein
MTQGFCYLCQKGLLVHLLHFQLLLSLERVDVQVKICLFLQSGFTPHALAVHKMRTTNHCGTEGRDNLFVCDRKNSRIQVFDDEGKYFATIRSVEYGKKIHDLMLHKFL